MSYTFFRPLPENIDDMQKLVYEDVKNGNILPRDSSEMANAIRSYIAVKENNIIIGFCSLHIHTKELSEIRSLVIDKKFRSKGIGKKLIQEMIDDAKELKMKEILVLTYKDNLFKKFDFSLIDKESIPNSKIWADCINCKHFPKCDEIALLLKL